MNNQNLHRQLNDAVLRAHVLGFMDLPDDFHGRTVGQQAEFSALRLWEAHWRGEHLEQVPTPPRLTASTPVADDKAPWLGFITPGLALGGAERWIISLLHHLDWTRLRCSGIALADGAGVNSPLFNQAKALAPVLVGAGAAGLLAACSDTLIVWGTRVPPEFAGRLVLVSHGCGNWSEERLRESVTPTTDLAAVSKPAAGSFGPDRLVTIIHNGVEGLRCHSAQPRQRVRAAWGVSPEEITVGYMGRFSWEKEPQAAAIAVAELGPPFRAVYIGGGRQADAVTRAVKAISPNAVIRGPVEQIGSVLRALDCFVLASRHEGFSLALTEAWYCGLPTVATRVGAVPELEEQHDQLTVPIPVNASPSQLAAAVRQAVSTENRPVVERAQRVTREHFTAAAMGRRWTDFLLKPRIVKPEA